MLKPSFRAALIGTTLALVLVPAGAASAQSVAVDDASGDTWKSTFNMETEEETLEPSGSQVNTDLVRTVVKHSGRKLVFTATYTDLKRDESRRFAFMAKVRTNEGLKREVGVDMFSRRGWGGTASVTKPSGREVPCRGLSHQVDYAANTVMLAVPRPCLSSPRWIQATVGAFSLDTGEGATFSGYLDNGHNPSADEPNTWTKRLRKG
jgi:hypothetical protein